MFLKVAVAVSLCIVSAATRHVNFYRRDYTYVEKYDAFYKLHWDDGERTWLEGFLTCYSEGAQLFYPVDDNEWTVAANMTDTIDIEYVYVGVQDELGRGDFITTDGRFIPELSQKTNNMQPNLKCGVMSVKTGSSIPSSCDLRKPFICKKLNNEYCPTADSGYFYSKTLKKCIKINENERTWANAMHTCIMEGGILSDSISDTDRTVLSMLLEQEKSYYIGFRHVQGDSFYSNRGRKITISRDRWTVQNDPCTTISSENVVTANDCEELRPFICEIQVKS